MGRLLGVLIAGLVILVLIIVGVSQLVFRLNAPAIAVVTAGAPTAAPQLNDCGNGIHVEAGVACPGAASDTTASSLPTQPPDPNPTEPTGDQPPVSFSAGHYDSGTKSVTLADDQAIIGQSYVVNGQGGGCQVFGGNGPATVSVEDGEWWVFPMPLSAADLERLLEAAAQKQRDDPQAECDSGSHITRI